MPAELSHQTDVEIADRARRAACSVQGVTDAMIHLARRPAVIPAIRLPPAADAAVHRPVIDRTTPAVQASGSRGGHPLAQVDGSPFVAPDTAPRTLTEALERAARSPVGRGTTYILDGDRDDRQPYRDLLDDAACLVPSLRGHGLAPGDSVLLHCEDSRNFVTGFWACLLGGFVPTPIAMAPTYQWENATTRRIRNAWDLLDRPPVLTDAAWAPQVAMLGSSADMAGVRILTVEKLRTGEPAGSLYHAEPDDPAVHLLTSGSTGVPKCVRHTHRSVVTRALVNAMANNFGPDDVTLNFMPLDHIGGMVMHNLRDVVLQCEHVNARMATFLADPLRWFTWIERYRVTNTFASNFIITLVNNLKAAMEGRHWDLSSLRDITNGGEAIVSSSVYEFLRLLAPHGMAPDVMRPAWGMSETCGGVAHSTLSRNDEQTGVVTADIPAVGGEVTLYPPHTPGHPTFTELGGPVSGVSLRIVGPDGQALSEDHVGRFQVRSVTLMAGYYNNPAANRESFTADGWFDTGDLAFIHGGRLVMTGREKDTIVIRGANFIAHEIEYVVGRVSGVLPTFVAACGEHDAVSGTDELLVFCALVTEDPAAQRKIANAVSDRLSRECGIRPRYIVPVRRGAFPKTSAGKTERARLLADYRAGAFDTELTALAAVSDGPRGGEAQDRGWPWLYQTTWLPSAVNQAPVPEGVWLVFGHGDLAERIRAERGREAGPVVSVTPAGLYHRLSELEYQIDPASQAGYHELLATVEREHGPAGAIIHGWAASLGGDRVPDVAGVLELCAPSVHRLIKACAGTGSRLLVVTTGACPTGDGDPVEPIHATVNGLIRTVNAERTVGWARQLDLLPGDPGPARAILAELADSWPGDVAALRRGQRLVSRLQPLDATLGTVPLRTGGLYLLTGGLGSIGFRLAGTLLAEYGATLVLSGRSACAGEKAARLSQLQQLGQVTYHQGDAADVAALQEAAASAEARSGRALDGVLHLAGADISGYWRNLGRHLLTREETAEFDRMYHAKISGTEAVMAVLEDRPDTLLVLFSSVNGHFGGTAFGAYASASSYLAAAAQYWRCLGRPVQCQAWSLWSAEGTASQGRAAAQQQGFRPIEPSDGGHLFQRALSISAANVLIGLDHRNENIARELVPGPGDHIDVTVAYRGAPAVNRGTVRDAVVTALGTERVSVQAAPAEELQQERANATPDRPAVGTGSRQDPVGDAERAVAEIWRETLEQLPVGRDDSFFELGGTSLTAIILVERLNAAFGCRLSAHHLYEHPTVREVAALTSNAGEPAL